MVNVCFGVEIIRFLSAIAFFVRFDWSHLAVSFCYHLSLLCVLFPSQCDIPCQGVGF